MAVPEAARNLSNVVRNTHLKESSEFGRSWFVPAVYSSNQFSCLTIVLDEISVDLIDDRGDY